MILSGKLYSSGKIGGAKQKLHWFEMLKKLFKMGHTFQTENIHRKRNGIDRWHEFHWLHSVSLCIRSTIIVCATAELGGEKKDWCHSNYCGWLMMHLYVKRKISKDLLKIIALECFRSGNGSTHFNDRQICSFCVYFLSLLDLFKWKQ